MRLNGLSCLLRGRDVTTTMVLGANEHDVDHEVYFIDRSCSTNALAPVLRVIQEHNAIIWFCDHCTYTKDQSLVDSHHKDLRRARAAACSLFLLKQDGKSDWQSFTSACR